MKPDDVLKRIATPSPFVDLLMRYPRPRRPGLWERIARFLFGQKEPASEPVRTAEFRWIDGHYDWQGLDREFEGGINA